MKKYLLAGGIATILLLGACGNNENEPVEEETTEEANTMEETDSTEETESTEEEVEEESEEIVEEEDEYTEEEPEDTNEPEEVSTDDIEGLKVINEGDVPIEHEAGDLDITITYAEIVHWTVEEDEDWIFENAEVGDTVGVLGIGYDLENNSDEEIRFDLISATLITEVGDFEPHSTLSETPESVPGQESVSGNVFYIMEDVDYESINSIELDLPEANASQTYEPAVEVENLIIEFNESESNTAESESSEEQEVVEEEGSEQEEVVQEEPQNEVTNQAELESIIYGDYAEEYKIQAYNDAVAAGIIPQGTVTSGSAIAAYESSIGLQSGESEYDQMKETYQSWVDEGIMTEEEMERELSKME